MNTHAFAHGAQQVLKYLNGDGCRTLLMQKIAFIIQPYCVNCTLQAWNTRRPTHRFNLPPTEKKTPRKL